MDQVTSEPSAGDEPTRIRLDELLADMQEVLTGLPARKLDPKKNEGLAELPTSGIFDMRDMATAYEEERGLLDEDGLVEAAPIELALEPSYPESHRKWASMVYFSAGALGVLLVALTAVATILVRAG